MVCCAPRPGLGGLRPLHGLGHLLGWAPTALCQGLIALCIENILLIWNLNHPSFNLKPFLPALALHSVIPSRPQSSSPAGPRRYWKAAIMSPQNLI